MIRANKQGYWSAADFPITWLQPSGLVYLGILWCILPRMITVKKFHVDVVWSDTIFHRGISEITVPSLDFEIMCMDIRF